MELSTNAIIELFKALNDLRGAPTIIPGENGKKQVVHEPYPMSEKAKWNAAKDRSILKRLVIARDEMNQDAMTTLNGVKKVQQETWKNETDPKLRAEKMQKASEAVQAVVEELNAEAVRIGRITQDVPGLLLIPANGLVVKGSSIPPTLVSELMELIEGEPDFGEPKK